MTCPIAFGKKTFDKLDIFFSKFMKLVIGRATDNVVTPITSVACLILLVMKQGSLSDIKGLGQPCLEEMACV